MFLIPHLDSRGVFNNSPTQAEQYHGRVIEECFVQC